jgi:hypothetical protein
MKKKNRTIPSISFNITQMLKWILLIFWGCNLFVYSYIQAVEPQAKDKQRDIKEFKGEIEADGYSYTYEAVPFQAETTFYQGRITVRGSDKKIVYQEVTPLQPGLCDRFPAISKFPLRLPSYKLLGGDPKKERWLVTLCGSYSGRHKTMKVFFKDPISLKNTTLHFEDTTPNLSDIDDDGFYEAQVYRRVFFNDVGYGVIHYLMVYKLNFDSSMFGFCPQFDSKIADKYFDYYLELKKSLKSEIISDYVGPMLAALLATQDKNKICTEIRIFIENGVTIKELQTWERRLTSVGYPGFNLSICKEVLK